MSTTMDDKIKRWTEKRKSALGCRLNQIQNAMRVAKATADRKFLASLS